MDMTATADCMETDSPQVKLMPPTVFYVCLALGGFLEWLFPSTLPWLSMPVGLALGIGLGAAGFGFMMLAHEKFKKVGTHVPTNLPATELVVRGAYQVSRNPMYVGGSAFFLGLGLTAGSLWMLAAYIPMAVYLVLYVVPREEAYMERTYGEAYTTYCRNVRRWL